MRPMFAGLALVVFTVGCSTSNQKAEVSRSSTSEAVMTSVPVSSTDSVPTTAAPITTTSTSSTLPPIRLVSCRGGVEITLEAAESRSDLQVCYESDRDFIQGLDLHPSLPEDWSAVLAGLLAIRGNHGDEPFVSSVDDVALLDMAGEVCGSAAAAASQDAYAVGVIARYPSDPTLSLSYATWEDWVVFEAGTLMASFCFQDFERLFP